MKETFDHAKQVVKETKDALIARMKIPLFTYYLLAFAVINWDLIFFMFAENTTALGRITYIKSALEENWLYRTLFPAVICFASPLVFTWLQLSYNRLADDLESEEILKIRNKEIEAAGHQKRLSDKRSGMETEKQYLSRIESLETLNSGLSDDNRRLNELTNEYQAAIVNLEGSNLKLSQDLRELEIKSQGQLSFIEFNEDSAYSIQFFSSLIKAYNNFIAAFPVSINEIDYHRIKMLLQVLSNQKNKVDLQSLIDLDLHLRIDIREILVKCHLAEKDAENTFNLTSIGEFVVGLFLIRNFHKPNFLLIDFDGIDEE